MGVLDRLLSVQDLVVLQTSTPEFADILLYKGEDWQAVKKVSLVSCMPEGLKEYYQKGKKHQSSAKSKRKSRKSTEKKKKAEDSDSDADKPQKPKASMKSGSMASDNVSRAWLLACH